MVSSFLVCQVYMITESYHVVCDGKEVDTVLKRHRFLLVAEDVCKHIVSYVYEQ